MWVCQLCNSPEHDFCSAWETPRKLTEHFLCELTTSNIFPHKTPQFTFPQSKEHSGHFPPLSLLASAGTILTAKPQGDVSPGLTGCLHHAGPEFGLLVERVVLGAAELVDVHAGRGAHAAVVADEHVKVLAGKTQGREGMSRCCHSQSGSLSGRRMGIQ